MFKSSKQVEKLPWHTHTFWLETLMTAYEFRWMKQQQEKIAQLETEFHFHCTGEEEVGGVGVRCAMIWTIYIPFSQNLLSRAVFIKCYAMQIHSEVYVFCVCQQAISSYSHRHTFGNFSGAYRKFTFELNHTKPKNKSNAIILFALHFSFPLHAVSYGLEIHYMCFSRFRYEAAFDQVKQL